MARASADNDLKSLRAHAVTHRAGIETSAAWIGRRVICVHRRSASDQDGIDHVFHWVARRGVIIGSVDHARLGFRVEFVHPVLGGLREFSRDLLRRRPPPT